MSVIPAAIATVLLCAAVSRIGCEPKRSRGANDARIPLPGTRATRYGSLIHLIAAPRVARCVYDPTRGDSAATTTRVDEPTFYEPRMSPKAACHALNQFNCRDRRPIGSSASNGIALG